MQSLKENKSILSCNHEEARKFFLKSKNYCNFELPEYFQFDNLLNKLSVYFSQKEINSLISYSDLKESQDVNHVILCNKDGKHSWRPLTLTNPVIYVAIVNKITEEKNWELIQKRFKEFASHHIKCLSIPIVSDSKKTDKSLHISNWLKEVEEKSLKLSLEYNYIIHTDITDCYSSIYTHSIPWSLHGKKHSQSNPNKNKNNIGNEIDKYIRGSKNGQTNGIPQGSCLMDFIAEIVLGYADYLLYNDPIINNLPEKDYQILRFRDDYRIFSKDYQIGEIILKKISETLSSLNLKLNSTKTFISNNIIKDSIKPDKYYFICNRTSMQSIQQELIYIYNFAEKFPNSGKLLSLLNKFNKKLDNYFGSNTQNRLNDKKVLIGIITNIAVKNPRIYPVFVSIIAKIIEHYNIEERKNIIEIIMKKVQENVPNTSYLEIWLQRLIIIDNNNYDKFNTKLCQIVSDQKNNNHIWNMEWLKNKNIKCIIKNNSVISEDKISKLSFRIPEKEYNPFAYDDVFY